MRKDSTYPIQLASNDVSLSTMKICAKGTLPCCFSASSSAATNIAAGFHFCTRQSMVMRGPLLLAPAAALTHAHASKIHYRRELHHLRTLRSTVSINRNALTSPHLCAKASLKALYVSHFTLPLACRYECIVSEAGPWRKREAQTDNTDRSRHCFRCHSASRWHSSLKVLAAIRPVHTNTKRGTNSFPH